MGKITLDKLHGEKFHRGARFECILKDRGGEVERRDSGILVSVKYKFWEPCVDLFYCSRDIINTDYQFLSLIGSFYHFFSLLLVFYNYMRIGLGLDHLSLYQVNTFSLKFCVYEKISTVCLLIYSFMFFL